MISGVVTAVLMALFIGIVIWAFSSRRKPGFDAAARIPLEDDLPAPDTSANDVPANDVPANDKSGNDVPANDVLANDVPADGRRGNHPGAKS